MTRILLLAVGLCLVHVPLALAGPPLEPAPSAAPAPSTGPAPLRRAGQPVPAEPDAPAAEEPTSPPADVSPAPSSPAAPSGSTAPAGSSAQPGDQLQTFEDEPEEEVEDEDDQGAAGTPRDVATFAESTMDARRLRFALNAFGDASLIERIPEEGDEASSFALGTFAMLINAQLGSSLLGTAEVAFDSNSANQQDIELERLQLRWQTDSFYVVGGRLHTDIGYWNAAFHHGAWLYLPIRRPRVIRGETGGGILPIHWVGVEGGVHLPIDPAKVTVSGGVGNGRGNQEGNINLVNDTNDFKAVKLKVEAQGLGLDELRVGVGGLYDRIAAAPEEVRPALPGEEIDEMIGNAYAAFRGVQVTLITEAYAIWHRGDDDTFTTTDAFVVAGYRIGRITPYVQVERMDEHGDPDPFYTPMEGVRTPSSPRDQTEALAGVRVDISVWSAIKAEYGALFPDGADGPDHTVMLNWSFGI
jgi:hypothetical protein